jgi:hypothetical protein
VFLFDPLNLVISKQQARAHGIYLIRRNRGVVQLADIREIKLSQNVLDCRHCLGAIQGKRDERGVDGLDLGPENRIPRQQAGWWSGVTKIEKDPASELRSARGIVPDPKSSWDIGNTYPQEAFAAKLGPVGEDGRVPLAARAPTHTDAREYALELGPSVVNCRVNQHLQA